MREGTAAETSHIIATNGHSSRDITYGHKGRDVTYFLHTGTAAEMSYINTHGHSGRDVTHCYTWAQRPRRYTLLHTGTVAGTSHIVTHGHSGGDITHCYTRAERLKLFFLKEVLIMARSHMAKYLRPLRQGLSSSKTHRKTYAKSWRNGRN